LGIYIVVAEAWKEVLWTKNFFARVGTKTREVYMFCDTTKVSFILPRIQTFILEPRILRCNTNGFEK